MTTLTHREYLRDDLSLTVSEAEGFTAFTLAVVTSTSLASSPEFLDDHAFLELADRTENLSDQHRCGIIRTRGQVGTTIGRNHLDIEVAELIQE